MTADNPKKAHGDLKVPLQLVPASSIVYEALAMEDGAEKYGPYNWREERSGMWSQPGPGRPRMYFPSAPPGARMG